MDEANLRYGQLPVIKLKKKEFVKHLILQTATVFKARLSYKCGNILSTL